MDIASLILSFATGTYTVTRRPASSLTRGRAEAATSTTFTITGSVSPASDDDLMRLPEGMRVKQNRQLFTTTQLQDGGQGSDYEPDLVSIEGKDWEVSASDTWLDSLTRGNGYRYVVTAIE